jgi:hypothetical protein
MSEEKKPYGRRRWPAEERPRPAGKIRTFSCRGYLDYCPTEAVHHESLAQEIHHVVAATAMTAASRCCGCEAIPGADFRVYPSITPGRPGYEIWVLGAVSAGYRVIRQPGELALRVAIARHLEWFETIHGRPWDELEVSLRDTELGEAQWRVSAILYP